MKFVVRYHSEVAKVDIPKLSKEWKLQIKNSIERKLTSEPEIFGKPLRHSLKGFRKLRVSDYRIIFRIQGKTIKIFAIQHRSVVYKYIRKRI